MIKKMKNTIKAFLCVTFVFVFITPFPPQTSNETIQPLDLFEDVVNQ